MDEQQPPEHEPDEVYQGPDDAPQAIYQIIAADGSILKVLGRRLEVSYDVGNRRVTAIYELDEQLQWVLVDIDWAD